MTGVCRRACVTGINRRGDGASRADRASKTAAAYILNSAVPTALYTTTAAVSGTQWQSNGYLNHLLLPGRYPFSGPDSVETVMLTRQYDLSVEVAGWTAEVAALMSLFARSCAARPAQFGSCAACATKGIKAAEVMRVLAQPRSTSFP